MKLAREIPHSVKLLEENIPGTAPFNCYQYAFGIRDVRLRAGILQIFPGRDFVQYLVDHYLKEVELQNVQDGDYVLYSGSQIEHGGKIQSGMIESKWGTGHIWRHNVYDVPADYGDMVRFFQRLFREDILRAALDFHSNARIEK